VPRAGCERVYHLAGRVDHRRRLEAEIRAANVDSVRVVLAATDPEAVSSTRPASRPSAPLRADAASMRACRSRLRRALCLPPEQARRRGIALEAAAEGRDVVVANIGFIIGPDDVERVTGWMVERYLRASSASLSRWLSFFDVRDAARGLVLWGSGAEPVSGRS
jgi:nucleoside-diphosphate-sugar epimerase